MDNKKVRKIVVYAENPLEYEKGPIKNGYKIFYEDFTNSGKIELPYTVDEYGNVKFTGFENEQILFKYKDTKNRDKQLMYLERRVVQLQEKFPCPECDGWLDETIINHTNYDNLEFEYTCVNCDASFLSDDLTKSALNFYPPKMYKIDELNARATVEIELKHEDGRTFYTKWELEDEDAMQYNDYEEFETKNIDKEEAHRVIENMFKLYVEGVTGGYHPSSITMDVFNEDDEICYTHTLIENNYEIDEELENELKNPNDVLLDNLEWGDIKILECKIHSYELE